MAEEVAQAHGPDLSGAQVLVAIGSRSAPRRRIVQVDEPEPVEPDPPIERLEEVVDRRRIGHVDPGPPRVRGVQAEPHGPVVEPGRVDSGSDAGELVDVDAHPEPTAGRVLQDDERKSRRGSSGRELPGSRDDVHDRAPTGLDARATVGADVDVHEGRPEPGGGLELGREELDRALAVDGIRAGRVHEVRGMDRDRVDARRGQPFAEGGQVARRLRSAPVGGRVVTEDLDRRQVELDRSFGRAEQPDPVGEVDPQAGLVGGHDRHRSRLDLLRSGRVRARFDRFGGGPPAALAECAAVAPARTRRRRSPQAHSAGEGDSRVPSRRAARLDPGQAVEAGPPPAGHRRSLLPRRPRLRGEGGQHATRASPPGRCRAPSLPGRTAAG